MKTPSEKRKLAAQLLRGYIKDPSTRGLTNPHHFKSGNVCSYLNELGNRCAVGKYLEGKIDDDFLIKHATLTVRTLRDYIPADNPVGDELDKNLPFFEKLQAFHDTACNFKPEGGLTWIGIGNYKYMISNINAGRI